MAGGVKVPFKVDATSFERGLAQMRKSAKSWGRDIGGIGRTVQASFGMVNFGALGGAIRRSIELAKSFRDMGRATLMSALEFQKMTAAAEKAGISQLQLNDALRTVVQRMKNAALGIGGYTKDFDALGLSAEKLLQLPMEQRFEALGGALRDVTDEAEGFRLSARLFGEDQGPRMFDMLKKISKQGFDEFTAGMKVMDEQTVESLAKAEEHIQRFHDNVTKMFGNITGAFFTMRDAWADTKSSAKDLGADMAAGIEILRERGHDINAGDEIALLSRKATDERKAALLSRHGLGLDDLYGAAAEAQRRRMAAAAPEREARAEAEREAKEERDRIKNRFREKSLPDGGGGGATGFLGIPALAGMARAMGRRGRTGLHQERLDRDNAAKNPSGPLAAMLAPAVAMVALSARVARQASQDAREKPFLARDVIASDLAAIGGGGSAALGGMGVDPALAEAREQTDLQRRTAEALEKIVNNTPPAAPAPVR